MPNDLERLPARFLSAAPAAGPTALAAELLGRVRAELPMIGELGEREQVLVSAWLTGLRSACTRRAYAGDLVAWLGWLGGRDTGAHARIAAHHQGPALTGPDGVDESVERIAFGLPVHQPRHAGVRPRIRGHRPGAMPRPWLPGWV